MSARQSGFRAQPERCTLALILRHAFIPPDNRRLAHVCGSLDQNLRTIEAALDVVIQRRNESFRVDGPKRGAERAVALLQQLYDQASAPIEPARLQLELIQVMQAPASTNGSNGPNSPNGTAPLAPSTAMPERLDGLDAIGAIERPADEIVLRTRRSDLVGRTVNQVDYLRNILGHDITFGIGPAGTGKTFLAVACAVDALERNQVQRIVLTRPAVEAGERLGFLPGDLAQKVDPYLRPLYDALYDLMGLERVGKAFEKGLIEIAPLAFMRGRTLNHAFVILDEAQNTTPEQMKMFLTRIGFGSRAVVTGDISQIDLPKGSKSGLVDAAQVLRRVRGIAHTRFTSADVVRHPLVARIVEAYDAVPDSARRLAEAEAEAALDAAARPTRPGARDGR
ncbi:phosphate starvation-inducible PhoH-like protein [Sphaerotilus mobilis]|uniref:PhoH-like protein n=1 Tax=Sphaerotilus mobilis TaxID=47994 RepID=A0A4Q7LKH2_9BURK|nr:phosphate starvation-inducible PhoH-like protein [Sphaerotilus mobilis]